MRNRKFFQAAHPFGLFTKNIGYTSEVKRVKFFRESSIRTTKQDRRLGDAHVDCGARNIILAIIFKESIE